MADAPGLSDWHDDEGWVVSSFSSGSGECVEVKHALGLVGVRDSKQRRAGQLAFPPAAWTSFVDVTR